ncbi:unnamed protein product [Ixodes persulcatus]
MIFIRSINNRVALVCVDSVYIYETADGGFVKARLTIPDTAPQATSTKSEEDADEESQAKEQTDQGFSCGNFSSCSSYFLAVSAKKELLVWKRIDVGKWDLFCQRGLARKCVQVRMCTTRNTAVVADRAGDVYAFELDGAAPSSGTLLLGRLSMALDMVIGEEDQFLAVCDRDEKIQVSRFPNCYNISTFCLGHTQFVSCLALLPNHPEVLVSGSGDGTVRVWCRDTGRQLHRLDLGALVTRGEESQREPAVCRLAVLPSGDTLACLLDGTRDILLLGWEADCLQVLQRVEHCSPPRDVCFDEEGSLWVVGTDASNPVCLYSPATGPTQDVKSWQRMQLPEPGSGDASELPCWAAVLKDMNQCLSEQLRGQQLPASTGSLATLYKQWFSNDSKYLEKKREREERLACAAKRPRVALSC